MILLQALFRSKKSFPTFVGLGKYLTLVISIDQAELEMIPAIAILQRTLHDIDEDFIYYYKMEQVRMDTITTEHFITENLVRVLKEEPFGESKPIDLTYPIEELYTCILSIKLLKRY